MVFVYNSTTIQNQLLPVFKNGELLIEYSLAQVRERAELPLVLRERK